MKLTGIIAMDKEGGIGKAGKLPWRFPEDLKRFKAKTMGHPMIMGRKTWDSFGGKALPGRPHIILSRDPERLAAAVEAARPDAPVHVATDIVRALMWADIYANEPYIIGGAEVYRLFQPYVLTWEITRIAQDYHCDTGLFLEKELEEHFFLDTEVLPGEDPLLRFETWRRK